MTAAEPKQSFIDAQRAAIGSATTNTPLRIALLGYRSHPFVGGQGIYLKYLSRALSALGHHIDVFSGPPYPELDENIRLIKIPSLDLFEQASHIKALRPKHLRSFTDTYEWWSMLTGGFAEPYTFGRRLLKRLSSDKYDIIHDNQSLCSALLHLQKSKANVVSTIHHPIHRDRAIALRDAKTWGDRLLIKRWYSFLNMQERVAAQLQHITTVSHTSQSDIEKYFGRTNQTTKVIPNGIDTDTFRPLEHIARKPLRIITTASSDQPLKGLQYLLDAIAKLTDKFPDIHLRVVGKLKPGGATESQLQQLGLEQHVSFVSGISTEALVEQYAKASIAICPSIYEGFGLPAGEAMSCGLPVISTDGGALPEVVGAAGIIVPTANSQQIADQIRILLNDQGAAKELGKRARQHIIKKFSWATVALQLTAYYESII